MNNNKWQSRYMDMARLVASWSKDPRTQVGAVVVDDLKRVVSVGYNGFPRGVHDCEDALQSRNKNADMVHAEVNAILNAHSGAVRNCTLICTHAPCRNCMLVIRQAGIKRLVFGKVHHSSDMEGLLEGIEVVFLA